LTQYLIYLNIRPVASPDPARVHRAIASLQRLTELFGERRRQLADEVGLSEAQWRVLEEISGESFMPSMFARRRDRTAAAVSRTLRQLLERRLVTVEIAETDARQRVYRLTREGRRVLARLRVSRERAIAASWARLSGAELERFIDFAESLCGALESYAADRRARRREGRRVDSRPPRSA
jgi:DNA-binding MarR family transcriptional regulator